MGACRPKWMGDQKSDVEEMVFLAAARWHLRSASTCQDYLHAALTAGLVGHDEDGREWLGKPVHHLHPIPKKAHQAGTGSSETNDVAPMGGSDGGL